jgi:hypothetical protein
MAVPLARHLLRLAYMAVQARSPTPFAYLSGVHASKLYLGLTLSQGFRPGLYGLLLGSSPFYTVQDFQNP